MRPDHPDFYHLVESVRRQQERPNDRELPTIPLPLLITGITGVSGYNALAYFQTRFPGQVFGLLPPRTIGFHAPDTIVGEITNRQDVADVFKMHRFASVLDCAGNCDLRGCQLDPKIAWDLNVEAILNLAEETRKHAIRLVHLSVDMVFGGRPEGGYREEEPICPVNVYGQTMAEGEKVLQETDPYAVTLRISLPMGTSFNGHAGALDWISSRFIKNSHATLYYDEVRTPTYTDCLSRVCRAMLAADHCGIFHAGASRRLSLYQIAQVINRVGGFSPTLLFGLMKGESCPVPPRVSNCTLDSSLIAKTLGYEPFSPWPAFDSFDPGSDRNWHYLRPDQEIRSQVKMNQILGLNPYLN